MGKTEVEWTLQLKEVHSLACILKTFSLEDLKERANQTEKEVRRNISILLSLGLIKSINIVKNIYELK